MTLAVDRTTDQYDIFECSPDGYLKWQTDVRGLIKARHQLRRLVEATGGEYFALRLSNGALIFHSESAALGKRVFQVAYDQDLSNWREHLLRKRGYGVLSVLGNSAALNLLRTLKWNPAAIGLFVIGHAAPKATRDEMAHWFKSEYPHVTIVALNPPAQVLSCADLNCPQNRSDLWLNRVSSIFGDPCFLT